MTTHSRSEQLVATAIDFGLTPAEQADVSDHLATCPACRAMAAAFRTDAVALREIAFAQPPARVRSAVLTAAALPAARTVEPWKLLAAAALLLAALLGAFAAIGTWNSRPTLVVVVPTASPNTSLTATPALNPSPAEPSIEPTPFAPPAAACPPPATAVRLPDVTVSVGGAPGIVATRGSSTTITCTTTGTEDVVPSKPTQGVSMRRGDRLVLTLPAGWAFLHVEGGDGPVTGDGGNVNAPIDTPDRPSRVEYPGPVRLGDSIAGLNVWMIRADGRAVGQLEILVRVHIDNPPATAVPTTSSSSGPGEPTGDLLFFRNPTQPGTANGSVWVTPAAGGARLQLGPAAEASWAADGRSVHLVTQDVDCVPSLITMAPDGSGHVVVSRGLRSLDYDFAWSPDERRVIFVRFRNAQRPGTCGSQGGVTEGPIDLWMMNADGSAGRVLVSDLPANGLHAAVWSPDSSQIAYLAPTSIPSQDASTSVAFLRVRDGLRTESGTSVVTANAKGLAWAPDGTRLAFSFVADAAVGIVHVAVVDAAVGSTGYIDLTVGDVPGMRLGVPKWSPDGKTIAITEELVDSGGSFTGADIVILDAAKGGIRRDLGITDADYLGTPTWSADGRWLAYVSQVIGSGTFGPIVEVATVGAGRHVLAGTSTAAASTTGYVDYVSWAAWQPAP